MHLGENREMNIKVCHISTVHPVFDMRIFYKECKIPVKDGSEVFLIVTYKKEGFVDGAHIVPILKIKNGFLRILFLPAKSLNIALKLKADVCHFYDSELMPIGVLLKLLTRKKVTHDVYENVPKQIWDEIWLSLESRCLVSSIYRIVEFLSLFFIDYIVIAEDSYIENYRNYSGIGKIRNYPILTQFNHAKEKDGSTRRNLVCVGGIIKLRSIFELLETVRILKTKGHYDVLLWLVGSFYPSHLLEEVNEIIKEYEISDNMEIIGEILRKKIYEILFESKIGIAILYPDPNYIESILTKFFEYMSAGLSVIISNFQFRREIVEELSYESVTFMC